MTAILHHLPHTGHICLADGSVLRLDFECQRYVGTWYGPDLSVKALFRSGDYGVVAERVAVWAASVPVSPGCGLVQR